MSIRGVAVGLLALAGIACGGSGGGGGGGGGGHPDAGPPQNKAWVRFGNLAPDAPAIDVCVRAAGTSSWGSPVLAANGVTGGLKFPAMSKTVFIDPGSLDFRAVAAGGTCDTPIGGDLTAQTIAAKGTYTLTAVGQLAPGSAGPFRLQQYLEHADPPASGKARFRFVNVIPNGPPLVDGIAGSGGAADAGTTGGADGGTGGTGGNWQMSLTEAEMPFRYSASGVGVVDGYQDIAPNPALPLTIRASPPQQHPDLYTAPINLRAGIITGVWAIGVLGGTGDQRLGYYVCDETPATAGGETTCQRE